MTLPVWTTTQILNQLGSGNYWAGQSVITYDFPTTTTWLTGAAGLTFAPLTAQQQTMATLAITLWGDLIAPTLQLVTQSAVNTGNIDIGAFTAGDTGYAFTYYPTAGTAWFNDTYNGTTGGATNDLVHPTIGKHGFATFIHELGHAFGLNHAGNYNAGQGTPEPTNYYDSTMYSIMSYFGPSWGDGTDHLTGHKYSTEIAWASWTPGYEPQTPMLNDVMAIQAAYGVSTTTRTGNTVYGFNSTITGQEAAIYDFTQNAHPIMCIFDSSGNDTLDLSGFAQASTIDLHSGAFSSCAGMTNNISIAYTATIENAIGGAGNDTIIANNAGDTLNGGAGNDILIAGAGTDMLIGGGGIDTASYAVSSLGVTVDLRLATAQVLAGDASGDILSGISNLIGSTHNDTLLGDANANVLTGNGGNDYFDGNGGNDTIVGGSGNDKVVYYAGLLSSNVNLGSGNDTLLINDGTLPTGFNLAASNIEQATWVQHDLANNQTWANITNTYDSAWHILSSSTLYDDNSHIDTTYDAANTQSWQTLRNDYNSAGQLIATYTLNDDNSRIEIFYDTTNIYNWQTLQNDYNAAGQLTATYYLFDNNTTSVAVKDPTDTDSWQAVQNDHVAAANPIWTPNMPGYGNTSNTIYDVPNTQNPQGSSAVNNMPNQMSYQSHLLTADATSQTTFDASNHLAANTTTMHGNSPTQTNYDVANLHGVNTMLDNYDASLHLINIVYA